jgi:hypothetical protein
MKYEYTRVFGLRGVARTARVWSATNLRYPSNNTNNNRKIFDNNKVVPLPKHHAMKADSVEVKLHVFLTSVLRCTWVVSVTLRRGLCAVTHKRIFPC